MDELLSHSVSPRGNEVEVFTGSYGADFEESIQILRYNSHTKRLRYSVGIHGIDSPSFVVVDSPNKRLFAVSEHSEHGEVVSYRWDVVSECWIETSRQATKGADPCYIALDTSKRWLLGVNYSSSSVFVFPITQEGLLGEMSEFMEYTGQGVHRARQERPHPHSITNLPGTDLWVVCDLGTDQLHVYRLHPIDGRLNELHNLYMRGGCGPRHVAFHPTQPIMYVSEELTSTVSVLTYDANTGVLTRLYDPVSTLPASGACGEDISYAGENTVADIHVSSNGAFVYVSNRGHDSLAVFSTQADGSIQCIQHVSTLGQTPRNFTIVEGTGDLLVANQDSNSINVFQCGHDGIPVWTGFTYDCNQPVCIQVCPL